jgi:hypothetical protein
MWLCHSLQRLVFLSTRVKFLLVACSSQFTAFFYFYFMADSAIAEQVVHDKATRSYKMSQIRSRNTKPEMLVRKFLHAILQVSYTLKVSDAFL